MFSRDPLEREPQRRQLQVALAHATSTQDVLAEKFGVTQPAISAFKKRHAAVIQEIRDNANNEFAGMALAQKQNRVAALIDLFEKSIVPTPKITNKGTVVVDPASGEFVYEIDGRAGMQALKQIAEELGQLVQRSQVSGDMQTTTTYKIVGVDPSDLT